MLISSKNLKKKQTKKILEKIINIPETQYDAKFALKDMVSQPILIVSSWCQTNHYFYQSDFHYKAVLKG